MLKSFYSQNIGTWIEKEQTIPPRTGNWKVGATIILLVEEILHQLRLAVEIQLFPGFGIHPTWVFSPDFWLPSFQSHHL